MRRLLIVSLKYSPGLRKEFVVIGTRAAEQGCQVAYLIAPEYGRLGKDLPGQIVGPPSQRKLDIVIQTLRELVWKRRMRQVATPGPAIVLFYNFHPLNAVLARVMKRSNPTSEIAVFVHDPKRRKAAFRLVDRLYYTIAEVLEGITIRAANHVIVASDYGRVLLQERFGVIKGTCHVARLLVPDVSDMAGLRREFVTMLGHYNSATGHEEFFDLVEIASRQRPDLKFALVTSSNVKRLLCSLSDTARRQLLVVSRPVVSEEEINEILQRSYVVLRLDRQLAQSGVVPLAFMNRASVIARDIPGLRQDIVDGYNGVLLPNNSDVEDVIAKIDYVKANFSRLSKAARLAYEERWSERQFRRYYGWLPLRSAEEGSTHVAHPEAGAGFGG